MDGKSLSSNELEFISGVLNIRWNDITHELRKKDLGDIERRTLEEELEECNRLMLKIK